MQPKSFALTLGAFMGALMLALMLGCAPGSDLSRVPDQYLMASVDGNRRQDAVVTVRRSPLGDRQSWTSAVLFQGSAVDVEHGPPYGGTRTLARGSGSAGIGSNGHFNVLAFWGRHGIDSIDAGTVTLYVATSQDGVTWTEPVPVHVSNLVHSNTDGIVRSAGISVAPQGLDGPWFAAFADRTGTITVLPLPIARDGAIIPPYIGGAVTVPGATTERAPGLSYLGDTLVLAWRAPGAAGPIRVLKTTNGLAWPAAGTAATALELGAPVVSEATGGPFLHTSLGSLYLTAVRAAPTGGQNVSAQVRTLVSSDGISFTEAFSYPFADPFQEGAAAAGPESELVVVYPTPFHNDTTVFGPGLTERRLPTNTNRRVTITSGAG